MNQILSVFYYEEIIYIIRNTISSFGNPCLNKFAFFNFLILAYSYNTVHPHSSVSAARSDISSWNLKHCILEKSTSILIMVILDGMKGIQL